MALNDNQSVTKPLEKLLRGELSAIETYEQVLEKMSGEPQTTELVQIASDHRQAVDVLTRFVRSRGGENQDSSGPWGTWASTVTGTAKVFGDTAALKALKEGEEHGIKEYEEALESEGLDAECSEVIRSSLLPRQRQHISALNRMMNQS